RITSASAFRGQLKRHGTLYTIVVTRPLSQISRSNEAFIEPSDHHPGIKYLSLNRPQSKNALSMRLLKELQECLDSARNDKDLRVLIVRSTALGSFCAGADLVERRTMSLEQVSKFLSDLRTAFTSLENLTVPTISAIDGPALGGGLELALACDFRIAGQPNIAKIGLPETRLGIIPGAGGTQRAVRLLGISKAKELVFTGRLLTASEAEEIGLVDYVSEPGTLAIDRALKLAKEIASNSPLALKAAKQALSRAPELELEAGLDFERACYEPLLSSKDRVEALNAFKEKRAPVFKGE
ncbi:ClpP/crotonase, partial [Phellopilus nigrolimitatus]